MMSFIKKVLRNMLPVSWIQMYKKLCDSLRRIMKIADSAEKKNLQECFIEEFRDLKPIPFFVSYESGKNANLNFVTDALGQSLLGGVGTALLLATQYARQKNMILRIITRHENANLADYYQFLKFMRTEPPVDVRLYSDYDFGPVGHSHEKLEITPDDEFFTTSWWSTIAVKNMHLSNKIFYILQEVESFFYPYGDRHLFCSRLMDEDNICFIVNSHYLWEYFRIYYPRIIQFGVFFEPAFPRFLYQRKNHHEDKYRLFFYCRKNHLRNLYWTGLQILDEALMQGMFPSEQWDIFLVGEEDHRNFIFSDGHSPLFLGLLSWEKYADFLSTVDLTFSLMYTPHPSYPPLDTIASGGVCVTNQFANKMDNPWCDNLIFGELSSEGMLEALRKGKNLALDYEQRMKNYQNSSLPASWEKSFENVISFMSQYRR